MTKALTIQMVCPNGDPANMRVVDKKNWTGKVFYISRGFWADMPNQYQDELKAPGIYVLSGTDKSIEGGGGDLPPIYIGQTENLLKRIERHMVNPDKHFYNSAVCVTGGDFNSVYFQWMEADLIQRAQGSVRYALKNKTTPNKPKIQKSEEDDTKHFLDEVMLMFPLVDVNVFAEPKAVSLTQTAKPASTKSIERQSIKNHNQTSSSKKSQIEIRNKIIAKFQEQKNVVLLKRSKATFHNASKSVRVACFISKEYKNRTGRYYLGPTKRAFDFLNEGGSGYFIFGMEGQSKAINFPLKRFAEITNKLSETRDKDTKEIKWWHIKISTRNGNFILHLKGRGNTIDISAYAFDIE